MHYSDSLLSLSDMKWNVNYGIAIIWPIIEARWSSIKDSIKECNVKIINDFEYIPLCNNKKDWFNFVFSLYMNGSDFKSNKKECLYKIKRKFYFEHLNTSKRSFYLIIFEVNDDFDYSTIPPMKNGFENAKRNAKKNNLFFEIMSIKHKIRIEYMDDIFLPKYKNGLYKGRKRVIHTETSRFDIEQLFLYLKNFPHKARVPKTFFDINRINGIESLKSLNLSKDNYVVVNSSWMAALGFRNNGDLDILIHEDLVQSLSDKISPPISLMKYVHWYLRPFGKTASIIIKKHSVMIDDINFLSFKIYKRTLLARIKQGGRLASKSSVDYAFLNNYKDNGNGLPAYTLNKTISFDFLVSFIDSYRKSKIFIRSLLYKTYVFFKSLKERIGG